MRILCVCAGGNTRSVTLATLLKYNYGGHDALACSIEKNSGETFRMLANWANKIFVVDREVEMLTLNLLLKQGDGNERKVEFAEIGQDKWGQSMHPDLVPLACRVLESLGFKTRKTWDEIVARGSKYAARRAADG